jgi:hypothetical protein
MGIFAREVDDCSAEGAIIDVLPTRYGMVAANEAEHPRVNNSTDLIDLSQVRR